MSNSENIVQTIKTTIQDVVAPDVRELKAKIEALDKRISSVEANLDKRISSVETNLREHIGLVERRLSDQSTAQFHALLAAISQSKAENELFVYKQVSALAERVTMIEAKLQQQSEARAA